MFQFSFQTRFHRAEPTAVSRTVLGSDRLPDWVRSACVLVAEYLRRHGIAPAGYPFARCRRLPSGLIEVEAGFPVGAPIDGAGPVGPSRLPAGPVVAVWHTDPDEKLAETYRAIDDWLHSEHAVPTGDSWEVYHDLPGCDRLGSRIEVVQPIAFPASN
jgi:effector-binding domain-containing protein